MNAFWVLAIIYNNGDAKPWLCSISKAQNEIEKVATTTPLALTNG